MKRLTLALMGVLALTACDRSKKQLEQTLVQVQQISAEKDSLLKDVMATQQLFSEINSEMARVRNPNASKPMAAGAGELPNPSPADQRAAILDKIKTLTGRLNEAESRLAASRDRVRKLSADNAALTAQLAQYDSTIAAYRTIIDNQKAEIASLTDQVAALSGQVKTLSGEKAQLTEEKTQLTSNVSSLTTERNTVHYVIGTKDELRRKGIIVKKGGVIGVAATDIPATNLDPAMFTTIDKTKVADIAFPKANKSYKILSRQDVAALEPAPNKNGEIRGGLHIKNAEQFWAAGKFLIIVEQ
ncbi:MAG: hypothetical protein K2X99_10765 [Gemmatimonadaceae bacterium]|nr:hypothetical protein [Gemmatimonadaceae bacterium]